MINRCECGLLSNSWCNVLSSDELHSEGMGLFLVVLEAFGLGAGGEFEGFFFIVGAA